jgi:alginate O-acetyltransferase complex protein AlgI
MLFHAPIFLFVFLPIALLGWLFTVRWGRPGASIFFLGAISLGFYSWWSFAHLFLLLASIGANYLLGVQLFYLRGKKIVRLVLALGVTTNLLLLAGFKYIYMLAETFYWLTGVVLSVPNPDLPLGISFFTFLQIAFLIDMARDDFPQPSFSRYLLFVTFFPHLIAGPLVHHNELIPQFDRQGRDIPWAGLATGLTIFLIGLFKKLVFSDQVGLWSDGMFNGAAAGIAPSFIDSWIGVLSFTLLIYFDFSAYSDMAIGLARMFDIRLPENFNSPYKASSIIDFWRRWHITLSRFLRDYLYTPLGGNRKGMSRQYLNLMVVMLLAGLWHGAAWNFVAWGAMHGFYLWINHLWRDYSPIRLPNAFGMFITFFVVMVAWVPFRASNWDSMMLIYESMLGFNGIVLPLHYRSIMPNSLIHFLDIVDITFGSLSVYGGGIQLLKLSGLLGIIWFLPNTQQLMFKYKPCLYLTPTIAGRFQWQPSLLSGIVSGVVGTYLIILAIQGKVGEFIYFQF